ncbi:hypothetical protein OI18_01735 [Flavihumibacter solisilvae]|uniref:Glycosyltransferase 2-like domain-containing protein n=1 Tax=Flavihumibacter solisilvae TaxID=1349421 RepID=A0A0C1LMB4_9BACT|nr:hypothetical protein OI18_01735 [Flavihumibacter solisilvae]
MIFVYLLTIILLSVYAVLIAYYFRGWHRLPQHSVSENSSFVPRTPVTVIIPARNEERSIGACIRSILLQDYPQNLLEVVVIDDYSTDNTAGVVRSFAQENIRLLSLKEHIHENTVRAYKKVAIETGISLAAGSLIVTTDADCTASPGWLKNIVRCHEAGAVLIAGPVCMNRGNGILSNFQSLDFLCLQGITAASVHNGFHNMCNGANLAYSKTAFRAVGGFKGIDHIASGDDMLLMHKIANHFPGMVAYLKQRDAIVFTEPVKGIYAFLQQRIRWASKAQVYEDKKVFRVLLLVYILNLLLLITMGAALLSLTYLYSAIALLALKTVIEWPFVYSVARFYSRTDLMKYFPFFQPVHILYTVVAGTFGQFGTYEWKGRKTR